MVIVQGNGEFYSPLKYTFLYKSLEFPLTLPVYPFFLCSFISLFRVYRHAHTNRGMRVSTHFNFILMYTSAERFSAGTYVIFFTFRKITFVIDPDVHLG